MINPTDGKFCLQINSNWKYLFVSAQKLSEVCKVPAVQGSFCVMRLIRRIKVECTD